MGLPRPASKGSPSLDAMRASTRDLGSLTTSWPLTSIAKIFLLILSADDPNWFRDGVSSGGVTSGLPMNASTSVAKRCSGLIPWRVMGGTPSGPLDVVDERKAHHQENDQRDEEQFDSDRDANEAARLSGPLTALV